MRAVIAFAGIWLSALSSSACTPDVVAHCEDVCTARAECHLQTCSEDCKAYGTLDSDCADAYDALFRCVIDASTTCTPDMCEDTVPAACVVAACAAGAASQCHD